MVFPLIDLTDKKILVAGASSGIGAETSRLLGKLGATVILVARREAQLQETLSSMEGKGHAYYCQDLSLLNDIEPFVKHVIEEAGPLDGYVHCAGVSVYRPISLFTPDVVRNVMDINFGSFIEMVRSLTKRKRFNSGMSIVGVSSVASQQGNQTKTVYSASKAADTENVIARQYLGIGEPLDVANMIAFLLSNASRFITGSTVGIDGGRLSS